MDSQQQPLDYCQGNSPTIKMEDQDAAANPHSVAAQQAAARDYQPVLEGPLVGDKTPSDAITQEYAKADGAYVQKTLALPQTYSHYRPIQGDGNCGWRAIGFSYYEKLIELGDQSRIEGEVARLMSLNHMLRRVGNYTYFEDFADEAIGLLKELAPIVPNDPGLAHVILFQRWNDKGIEGSLIYYFRLLAATYLKGNAANYDAFVPGGQGVAAYCSSNIEIVNREIEELGIVALTNILLKPLKFVIEIAYLDRSPGSQVNRYRFPEEANKQNPAELGPTIYLLYRPDHYDILYLAPTLPAPVPVPAPNGPVSLQVNRVSGFSSNINIASAIGSLGSFATADMGLLAMLPGAFGGGGLPGLGALGSPTSPASPIGEAFSPAHQQHQHQQHNHHHPHPHHHHHHHHNQPWMTPYSDPMSVHHGSGPPPPQPPVVMTQPSAPGTPLTPSPSVSSLVNGPDMSCHPTTTTMDPTHSLTISSGYPIRFSPVQYIFNDKANDDAKGSFSEPTFNVQTSTFKNSIWNRAHYGNPDFHPEEWIPEDDLFETRGKRKSRRDH
ncbi:Ubiquitin thioesterase OTUB1 [Escovopsis weberi]|uniref:ubiquitinyl hydrolase 1 n=1 Tax=Escovopsis weberi TaxID=150374 RepID=A0A0M8MTS5_ESCWE|nr:Ubiquitin thioesterase OTUB1 [Escovopsis weberi]